MTINPGMNWQTHVAAGMNMLQASTTPPPNPAQGDCYFNTIDGCMYIYAHPKWLILSSSNGKEWALFLDDERAPADANYVLGATAVLIARSVHEAQALVQQHGLPCDISYDHDLGQDQPVSTKFMWWLINGHLDETWDCTAIRRVRIHSANIKGAENLHLLWEGFCKAHDIKCDIHRVKALQK
jgi:hypothetical protein